MLMLVVTVTIQGITKVATSMTALLKKGKINKYIEYLRDSIEGIQITKAHVLDDWNYRHYLPIKADLFD